MTARENHIVGAIDRRRERAEAKESRTARQRALEARADSFIACEIGEVPANDHPAYSECLSASIRRQLVKVHGPVTAASILSREAYEAGRDIMPRKIAQVEAERLFAKAANDGGEG